MSDIEITFDIQYIPYQRTPRLWPIGTDQKWFFKIEKYMIHLLINIWRINMNTDGHVMYWAIGIFISYLESTKYKNKWRGIWAIMSLVIATRVALDVGDDITPADIRKIAGKPYHRIPLHVFTSIELTLLEVCNFRLYKTLSDYLPLRYTLWKLELTDHRSDHITMAQQIIAGIVDDMFKKE